MKKKNDTLTPERNAADSRSVCSNDYFRVSRETPSTNKIILFGYSYSYLLPHYSYIFHIVPASVFTHFYIFI